MKGILVRHIVALVAVLAVVGMAPVAHAQSSTAEGPQQLQPVDPIKDRFGVGARVGGYSVGLGASVRYWFTERIGFEFVMTRSSLASGVDLGIISDSYDASVTQFMPALMIGLNKVEKDSVVFAPYVGGGPNIYRTSASISVSAPGARFGFDESETSFGAAAFVGVDVRLRSVPAFGFGADVGYYSTAAPFTGSLEVGGIGIGVTGHYYFQ